MCYCVYLIVYFSLDACVYLNVSVECRHVELMQKGLNFDSLQLGFLQEVVNCLVNKVNYSTVTSSWGS